MIVFGFWFEFGSGFWVLYSGLRLWFDVEFEFGFRIWLDLCLTWVCIFV